MKKILRIIFAAIGVIILRAYLSKWVPFMEFTENEFRFAVTAVWAYGGGFVGILFMAPLFSAIVEEFRLAEKLFW